MITVTLKCFDALTCNSVPFLKRLVTRATNDVTIGQNGDTGDTFAVPIKRFDAFASALAPLLKCLVIRAANDVTIWQNGDTVDATTVPINSIEPVIRFR